MVKRLMVEKADRLYHLPPTLDEFLPRREKLKMLGREVIDLARLNWPQISGSNNDRDMSPAPEKLIMELKDRTAEWYQNRFGVKLKTEKEIFISGRIRETLNLAALALFNPGDVVLIPDPGIWHYRAAAVTASAETVRYNLTERQGYQPSPDILSENLTRLGKAVYLNNPHNPTGATLTDDTLLALMRMAGKDNLLLILDQAFDGITDGSDAVSLFRLPGGRKLALELYSYAYNMGVAAPSLGFAIGQAALINGLSRMAWIFGRQPLTGEVEYALKALDEAKQNTKTFHKKIAANRIIMDRICKKVRLLPAEHANGPFYWAKLPGRRQSRRFCRLLYLRCGILAVPGVAFGENGEGFVRFALMRDEETLEKALKACERFITLKGRKDKQDG